MSVRIADADADAGPRPSISPWAEPSCTALALARAVRHLP
ncbi:hypothetical protein T261_01579 [Streptomyces lydicus]|nr:hypothetical protein T261_01579 [Streptomyces lydicus]